MNAQTVTSTSSRPFAAPTTVMVRPLLLKPQWMKGLSERLLVSHYENNYLAARRSRWIPLATRARHKVLQTFGRSRQL